MQVPFIHKPVAQCRDQLLIRYPPKRCCCRIGREGSLVGKTAICSLNTSSVWTDLEFGNSIRNGSSPGLLSRRLKEISRLEEFILRQIRQLLTNNRL